MSLAKRLAAWWDSPGLVRWHLPVGNGWQASGRFTNCVSRKCLARRVRLILEAPREPPSRVYRLADVALDYLVGMVSDVELASYEVRLGAGMGGSRYPELFLALSLTYDVYDCPDGDEVCEGWWLEVAAEYDAPNEWCTVEWSRYVGADVHTTVRSATLQDAVLRAAHKALKHAYNARP